MICLDSNGDKRTVAHVMFVVMASNIRHTKRNNNNCRTFLGSTRIYRHLICYDVRDT